jgi:hypothetical protein
LTVSPLRATGIHAVKAKSALTASTDHFVDADELETSIDERSGESAGTAA